MADGALDHLVADARVRAGVADDPRANGEQLALLVAAHRVVEPHRVALGVEAEALPARQGEEHGPPGAEREQGGVALDVEVLLGPESPARRHVGHADAVLGQAEERGDLAAVVPDALSLREDLERPSPSGAASADSGSRKACSMNWVRNDSLTTCAAPARAASASPRCTFETERMLPPLCSAARPPRGRRTDPRRARAPRTRPRRAPRPRVLRGGSRPRRRRRRHRRTRSPRPPRRAGASPA